MAEQTLTMTNITSGSYISEITLTYPSHTTYELIVNNIASASTIETFDLVQEYTLSLSETLITPTTESPTLVYPAHIRIVTPAAITCVTAIEAITLTLVDYFPWQSIGWATGLSITELAQTIRHEYPGYTATRAKATKMQKRFALSWSAMSSDQWLALITFWRSQNGGANGFYFEFPLSLYGAGSFGGVDGAEPADGFDAERGWGFGDGPTFLVRFENDELPQQYLTAFPGYWAVSTTLIEVA